MSQLSSVLDTAYNYYNEGIGTIVESLITKDQVEKALYAYDIKAASFDVSLVLAIITAVGSILGSISPLVPIAFIAVAAFIDAAMSKTGMGWAHNLVDSFITPKIPFFKPIYSIS